MTLTPHTSLATSADASERYRRAYKSVLTSIAKASQAIEGTASLEFARIERKLRYADTTDDASGQGPNGRRALVEQFLRVSAFSLGMSDGALVLVIGHTYFGALIGSAGLAGDLHFRFGEGPAIDARRSDAVVDVADLAKAATRWPGFAPAALEAGVRAAVCIPLHDPEKDGLVLSFSGRYPIAGSPRSWTATRSTVRSTSARLQQLARIQRIGKRLLLADPEILAPEALCHHLENAVESKAVIYQASGAIAQQLGVEPSVAIDILRFQAWADHTTLEELSARLLRDS